MRIKSAVEILRLRAEKDPELKKAYLEERANFNKEKNFFVNLGKILIQLVNENNKSFEKIAYEAEVSKTYFYKILDGKANPSILILRRIASALSVSVWRLIKIAEGL